MTLNLASILSDSAVRNPSRPALVLDGLTLDHATVDLFARRFAGAVRGLGPRPGEPVALLLPNVPHFTIAYFGCHYAGNPVVPLNVLLTEEEISYHLADSGAVALVAWEAVAEKAVVAAARTPGVRHVVVARSDLSDLTAPEGCISFTSVVGGAQPVTGPHPTGADDTAVILYTSGTTGRPKGAELTHANLWSNATGIAQLVSLEPGTVALVALPLFHAFGMTVMHNAVLAVGGSLVLMPRFDPAAALAAMRRHRVTFFGGVPTMFVALLREAQHTGDAGGGGLAASGLDALRWCVSGGAPMPAEVAAAFESRFGLTLLEGYGLSETSPVVSFTVPDRPRTPGSIGYPLPGVEMRLVDGEICVRGPNVMKGYLNDPEATAAAFVDGWFRTGDIGEVDEHGAYRIVDRKKDVVIRGGYKVYPREVEEVLHRHPAIALAAVVGTADDRYGEEVKAVVTVKPGRMAEPGEIVAFCRRHLAAYKCPRIVEVREELPLGPTGKVLKSALR